MAREFRLDLKVTLPEGDFDEAAALVALKPVVEAFEETLRKMHQPDNLVLGYSVVFPRPRGADKGDAAAQYAALGGKVAA